MAVDGDTAQIGPELAQQLGLPHLTEVCEITPAGEGRARVRRLTQRGGQEVEVTLPAVLTLVREINTPRMPTLAGVRRGEAASIRCWGSIELGVDESRCGLKGSPTQVVRTFVPARERETAFLTGDARSQAEQMLKTVREVLA